MFLVLLTVATVISTVESFYLPDQSPVHYCPPENAKKGACQSNIDIFVNRLSSINSLLTYDYGKFDLCMPARVQHPRENLGQVMFGDRISNSPYSVVFGQKKKCAFVCKREYQPSDNQALDRLDFLVNGIKTNYMHYWIIDNMPVTWCVDTSSASKSQSSFATQCSTGFPLGCHIDEDGTAMDACRIYESLKKPGSVYIFNHVDIELTVNPGGRGDKAVLISAKVTPRTIRHPLKGDDVDCWNPKSAAMDIGAQPRDEPLVVKYSYSIEFKERHDLKWSSRWNYILTSISDSSIHWLSIVNSLLVVVFLSILLAVILLQALRRDIAQYNSSLPVCMCACAPMYITG
eukprot:scpid56209/ scgid1870/ Transmembrane 9 superfamily member 2